MQISRSRASGPEFSGSSRVNSRFRGDFGIGFIGFWGLGFWGLGFRI